MLIATSPAGEVEVPQVRYATCGDKVRRCDQGSDGLAVWAHLRWLDYLAVLAVYVVDGARQQSLLSGQSAQAHVEHIDIVLDVYESSQLWSSLSSLTNAQPIRQPPHVSECRSWAAHVTDSTSLTTAYLTTNETSSTKSKHSASSYGFRTPRPSPPVTRTYDR